ncbi:MAG TPA: thiamine-phosphate kinase [Candidatus Acidoferrales bacterium]|jgi:thiamine-monophosphate kinase|nr:thiamine-phosphate kinase [Candidatus Acidoferrales bacterium]
MVKEGQLVERVSRRFRSPDFGDRPATRKGRNGLVIGIGDDAAVLRPRVGTDWVLTTDAFLENVHFLRNRYPAKAVGYKALARATSDIAAMGARARYFFWTVGLPEACAGSWFDDFLDGMARAARRFGLILAGGDTTKYPLAVASLTVLGEIDRGMAILRSGARPGDLLCVSGSLGQAELGLRLVQSKSHRQKGRARLLHKHFYPEPRLALGQWLAAHRGATSMIDTSDGLSTDLSHICKASGVGAVVWAAKIPTVKIPPELRRLGLDPLHLALHGGEDYELLFTVREQFARRMPRKLGGVTVTVIGEITREKTVILLRPDGSRAPLQPEGWDPFRA